MKRNDSHLPATRGELRKGLRELRDALKGCATKRDLKACATKRDLKACATKRDLKACATKEDLKACATKEDLKACASKEDLKAYSTKRDLEDAVRPLAHAIVRLQDDVASIKEQMATKEDINRIVNAIDELTIGNKLAWDKLTVHDVRIRALEEHTGLAPRTVPVE